MAPAGSPLTTTCPQCGFESPADARYCTDCGAPLRPDVPPMEEAGDTGRGRDRTKTGFLLLLLAFLLSAVSLVPLLGLVGIVLAVIGVVLIYRGAPAFGRTHRTYVRWSIVAWVLVILGLLGAVFAIVVSAGTALAEGVAAEDLGDLWLAMAVAVALGGSLLGIPNLAIGYRLLGERGRTAGWAVLAVHVALSVGLALYLWPLLAGVAEALVAEAEFPALETDPVVLLFGLGNVLWAALYYLVYRRVASGTAVAGTAAAPPGP